MKTHFLAKGALQYEIAERLVVIVGGAKQHIHYSLQNMVSNSSTDTSVSSLIAP